MPRCCTVDLRSWPLLVSGQHRDRREWRLPGRRALQRVSTTHCKPIRPSAAPSRSNYSNDNAGNGTPGGIWNPRPPGSKTDPDVRSNAGLRLRPCEQRHRAAYGGNGAGSRLYPAPTRTVAPQAALMAGGGSAPRGMSTRGGTGLAARGSRLWSTPTHSTRISGARTTRRAAASP